MYLQKEKNKSDEDHHMSKASKSYFPTLSTLKGKHDSEVPHSPLRFLHSYVSESHLTSPISLGRFSSYEYDNESVIASSIISEEIGVSTYEFRSFEDAEEEFLQDHEGYFLHLEVDNVRKDQYPKLELQRLVYLDYATCPLYSQFQVCSLIPSDNCMKMGYVLIESLNCIYNKYASRSYDHDTKISTTR